MRTVWATCAVSSALLVVPTVATAASLQLENGEVTYRARSGEVNRPVLVENGGTGLLVQLVSDSVPVRLGPGCTGGAQILCGAPFTSQPIDVALGNLNDTADVSSFGGPVTVDGGTGNDAVRADADIVTAYGGYGNDTIRIFGQFGANGYGGAGDDRIFGSGANNLFGDGGDDLLAAGDDLTRAVVHGGGGDDRLVEFETRSQTELSGDGGNDLIVLVAGRPAGNLNGGSGTDVIAAGVGTNVVDGGSGHDAIDVTDESPDAAADTVTCGTGYDVVWADANDQLAADCELRLAGPAPALPGVAQAIADATALAGGN
jgi:Ca2+-binding RTX toxin-like protein